MTGTSLAERMESGAAAVAQGEQRTLLDELNDPKFKAQITRVLPSAIAPDRFLRLCLTQLRTTRKLASCTHVSFLGAVMTAAQLGLEVDVRGLAYLIPRWNSNLRANECTLLIGYRGYLDLARRSGVEVQAEVVYENDEFLFEYGTDARLRHVPTLDEDRGRVVAGYAVAQLPSGASKFMVLRADEIGRRRGRSQAGDKGPWVTDFEAMARKTVVRALASYLPQTVEFAQAVALDETVRVEHTLPLEAVSVPEQDEGEPVEDAELVDETAGGAGGGDAPDGEVSAVEPPPATQVAGEPGHPEEPGAPVVGDEGEPLDAFSASGSRDEVPASPAAVVDADRGGVPPSAPVASAYRRWGMERLAREAERRNEEHDARIPIPSELDPGSKDELVAALALDDVEHPPLFDGDDS